MPKVLRCSQGHQWALTLSTSPDAPTPPLTCPICGLPGLDFLGEAPAQEADKDTVSFEPGMPVPSGDVPVVASPKKPTTQRGPAATTHPGGTPPTARIEGGGHTGAAPAPDCAPTVDVPGYEVLGLLGRGGMGVVYKARQKGLKRLTALKMILAGVHASPEELARFRSEAEVVARLQHPNIVQIYEVGEQHGCPYFSLEYLEGGSLSQKLNGTPQPPRQAGQLVEVLARAVHYAHQRGIVHRDLKPANVLLTSDGIPKITDFGVAKQLGDQSRTHTGAILGTPSYMAPEQAQGQVRQLGPAVDIYSLGAILYELLTGRAPFVEGSTLDILERVRTQEPVPPTRLQPAVPRDLETICLACLRKEPPRRYASAEALAEDLRAYLAGEPIRMRPLRPWEKIALWARRRPAAALLAGASAVAVGGLAVGIWVYNAVAVGAVAALTLLLAAGWYNARLQRALRQVAEQRLLAERNVERLHLLLELTHRLLAAPDLKALLQVLCETTARLVNAERATIFLMDRERRELWSQVALGDDIQEIRLALGVGIAGTVAATGRTINIPDAYADSRFNPEVDRRSGYTTRNLLTFPLMARDGGVLGVLQILNKRGGPFVAEDEETLEALAASAALAVENAQRRAK